MIERTDADIIAELTYTDIKTGEPATSYIKKALRLGKSVVTSNKGPAALHYREIQDLARQNGLQFRIEGTVMSGTPVFHLAECGLAGNTHPRGQGHPQRDDEFHPDQDGDRGHGLRPGPGPGPEARLRRGRPDRRRRGLRRPGQGRHPVERPARRLAQDRPTSPARASRPSPRPTSRPPRPRASATSSSARPRARTASSRPPSPPRSCPCPIPWPGSWAPRTP